MAFLNMKTLEVAENRSPEDGDNVQVIPFFTQRELTDLLGRISPGRATVPMVASRHN